MAGEDRARTGPVRPLFTVAEVAEWTGAGLETTGETAGSPLAATAVAVAAAPDATVLSGVEVDSRFVRPGDLFCALPGERVDGHAFVGRAFAAGALAALVARRPGGPLPAGGWLLYVGDPLSSLGELARRRRNRFSLPVIGVTGSVGKTTTKDLIAAALGTSRTVLANRGNLNTDIGLPLTIFELGPEHEIACLELAMRGPGEITRLAAIAQPSTGVITNIGPVHIELLGSVEAIARAKEELLDALPGSGAAVLNADDPRVLAMAERHRPRLARVLTYGLERAADVVATEVRATGFGESVFKVVLCGTARDLAPDPDLGEFTIPLGGRHTVSDALAAVGCGLLHGAPPDAIRAGLARPVLSAMRQETTEVAGVRVINDAYNAGPASMAASIGLLAETRARRGGRAIAVLGDMLELGPLTEPAHREAGRLAARAGLDRLVAVGPKAALLAEEASLAGLGRARVSHHLDRAEVADVLLRLVEPGDTVLIKASRGMGLEEVAGRLIAGLRVRAEGGAGR